MKIYSENGDFIEFTMIEKDERGDCNMKVWASVNGFQATNESIWFASNDIQKFLNKFLEFDKARSGTVSLDTMSPNECKIDFYNIDKLGHIGTRIMVSKTLFQNGRSDCLKCDLGFEVDSDCMNGLMLTFANDFA